MLGPVHLSEHSLVCSHYFYSVKFPASTKHPVASASSLFTQLSPEVTDASRFKNERRRFTLMTSPARPPHHTPATSLWICSMHLHTHTHTALYCHLLFHHSLKASSLGDVKWVKLAGKGGRGWRKRTSKKLWHWLRTKGRSGHQTLTGAWHDKTQHSYM